MNLKDATPGLRVSFYEQETDQWIIGTIIEKVAEQNHLCMVQPERGGAPVKVGDRNLRFAPPFHGIRLRFPRHMIQKLLVEGNSVVIEIDASSTYHAGYSHPCNVEPIPSELAETKQAQSRGLYIGATDGDLILSKTEAMG